MKNAIKALSLTHSHFVKNGRHTGVPSNVCLGTPPCRPSPKVAKKEATFWSEGPTKLFKKNRSGLKVKLSRRELVLTTGQITKVHRWKEEPVVGPLQVKIGVVGVQWVDGRGLSGKLVAETAGYRGCCRIYNECCRFYRECCQFYWWAVSCSEGC